MTEPVCTLEDVLCVNSDNQRHFVGVMPSDVVEGITQVIVFEGSKKSFLQEVTTIEGHEGYQRSADPNRQGRFGKYVAEDSSAVVPPVILNCMGHWKFVPYDDYRPGLGRLQVYGRANVIDGQHRLGGYIKVFKEKQIIRDIDFVAYENFNLDREKYVFDTINTQQKGVPGALSAVIHSEIWQNRIARRLAEDASSPFCGKISMAGNPGQHFLWKLNAVAKNVQRTFSSGAFTNTADSSKYNILTEAWAIISDVFSDEWEDIDLPTSSRKYKMLELTGLIAWSYILERILTENYNAVDDTVNWDSVKQRIELFDGRIDWDKNGEFKGQTGEYGGRQIARAMELILAQPKD